VELFLGERKLKKSRGFRDITKDTFVCRNTWKNNYIRYFRSYFNESGADVTAFIGGIVEYNSNLIGSGKTVTLLKQMNLIVRFAFASLILPSMDADHLIYGTSEAIEESLNLHLNRR
jgi:hypothetical protein